MSGPPVSLGCAVVLSPWCCGPTGQRVHHGDHAGCRHGTFGTVRNRGLDVLDDQFIVRCAYVLPIGPLASTAVTIDGQALVRVGDQIPSGPGVMTIIGPPAAPFVIDGGAP